MVHGMVHYMVHYLERAPLVERGHEGEVAQRVIPHHGEGVLGGVPVHGHGACAGAWAWAWVCARAGALRVQLRGVCTSGACPMHVLGVQMRWRLHKWRIPMPLQLRGGVRGAHGLRKGSSTNSTEP